MRGKGQALAVVSGLTQAEAKGARADQYIPYHGIAGKKGQAVNGTEVTPVGPNSRWDQPKIFC